MSVLFSLLASSRHHCVCIHATHSSATSATPAKPGFSLETNPSLSPVSLTMLFQLRTGPALRMCGCTSKLVVQSTFF